MQNSNILLQNIGIQQWYPRKSRHPWYQQQDTVIDIGPAIFRARCMILLPLYDKQELSIAANKILTGMLTVLKLLAKEIAIAKIYTIKLKLNNTDWQQIFMELNCWQPQFILQLEKSWQKRDDKRIVATYHPEYLVAHKLEKANAYQDLLTLKNRIHAL